jgi:thiopeptide-type bacteriocin biosynthesis protein
VKVLPRFLYRAPLSPVGKGLEGPMAELALALHRPEKQALANYARRASWRATPHGLWAGVGVGTLSERTRASTGAMRAKVTVAYERLWRFARAALEDPAARAAARVRVAPSLMVDETTALWLAFGEDEALLREAEVDDVLMRIVKLAADWVAWPALAEGAGVDDEYLFVLLDDGLLLHDGAPPLVGAAPLEHMAARHEHWRELKNALAAPTAALLAGIEEPLHAVLVHDGEVTLSTTAVTRAASLGPLLFRLQAALAPPLAERALDPSIAAALSTVEESFGAGAYDVPALALGRFGVHLHEEAPSERAPAMAPLHAVLDGIVAAIAAGEETVALDAATLDALLPPRPTPPTFELFLTPLRERRGRGVAPGDGWLIGLHAPAGATAGRFLHALGAPLAEALAPLGTVPGAVDLDYAPSLRAADLAAHPPLFPATLALSTWSEGEAVTPSELKVALDAARGPAELQRGETTLTLSPLGRLRSTTAPPGVFQWLTGFSLVRQHAPWAFSLGALSDLAYIPRVTIDGFVLAPASWRVPRLASRRALTEWRRRFAVPAEVQVGHGDELLRLDLDDQDAHAILERQEGGRAFEVWPPATLSIDRGGRRIEAVISVVDDEYEAPAPLGRAAAEPAHGWQTFKLMGAADRADRVLCETIAPTIAAARAAGELDAWFFLRYLEHSRPHLRLRVRAPDASPFAARLEAALASARGLCDVVAVERSDYYREIGRYGEDAIERVEHVFESDSELVLALLTSDLDAIELAVASLDTLAAGAGLDERARHALAEERRHAYGVGTDEDLAVEYRARQASLRALVSSPPPPFGEHRARVAAAIGELPASRRHRLLLPLLHLACVRLLGVDAAAEAAAFYFWERTRESLAKARR